MTKAKRACGSCPGVTKILFGRERSSAHSDQPLFLRELLERWRIPVAEDQFETILLRARAAVATSHDRHYLTLDEFREIAEGAVLAGRG